MIEGNAKTALLALDTSTDACSVAVLCEGEVTGRFVVEPRSHARLCLPMVDECLVSAGLSRQHLEAIAFGRGPGSFTGVRIATALAQGLGYALQIPVVPVSTLAAMAYQFGQTLLTSESAIPSQFVVPLLDARMNEIYTACYQLSTVAGQLLVSEVHQEQVIAPEKLFSPSPPFSLVGSGLVYFDRLPNDCHLASVTKEDVFPHASAIARLGAILYRKGQWIDAIDAEPTYLRNEVSWKKMATKN